MSAAPIPCTISWRDRTAAALLLLGAVYSWWVLSLAFSSHLHVDFFGFWSSTRFVATHPAPDVYNQAQIDAFQYQLDPTLSSFYRFLYPPSLLLLITPLAPLSYTTAYRIWTALSLLAYLAAAGTGRRPVLALLLAPTTAIAIFYGQTGLLAAALLLGGLRLLPGRPLLAGILFGLLTIKPQFGLLLPVALIAARQWRCIAASALTFLASVLASSLAFGWQIWPVWLRSLSVNGPLAAPDRLRLEALMPTISANLDYWGLGAVAGTAQLAAALICAVLIWRVWRHGVSPLGIAALAAAALLATPYAFVYDMPLVTAAALLAAQAMATPTLAETLVLALAVVVPAELFTPLVPPLPLGPLALAALLAVILRRSYRFLDPPGATKSS